MSAAEWKKLWTGIDELVEEFDDRLVFIGGVAVYLHVVEGTTQSSPANLVEFSHDGDFLISKVDFSTLRDTEEVVPNSRLRKYQIEKYGVDFDVYLESSNSLVVPYDEAFAASVIITSPTINKNVRAACLEHLLVLKLDAYEERRGSAKGSKDERDIIRIAYASGGSVDRDLIEPYLSDEWADLLVSIKKSSEFLKLTNRNVHKASELRKMFSKFVDEVVS